MVKRFSSLRKEYDDMLKAYVNAVNILQEAVSTVLSLSVETDDPQKLKALIDTLRTPLNRIERF